ncbi:MAG TPA: NAD(P)/FAD-dependent oxidoreductase [Polyangiaceae bacterium]|nr:NAD(P)/FAD-dependent oxidoreductase [Polyangiaceae bacterium]
MGEGGPSLARGGSEHTDVAIIGAGPTGSAAAVAFARRGARVALIDGHPEAAQRFAGEWIHPPGVRTLRALGVNVEALARSQGHGFALFGDDGLDPVCLPYEGGIGIARVHGELVTELREHACAHAGVRYLPHHLFTGLDGNTVHLLDRKTDRRLTLKAERIVGADGRGSKVRAALGQSPPAEQLSYMAGLELEDAPLPFEGLGHVFLGGPGPALLYRVDERRVRACLDIPSACASGARRSEVVYESFRKALPPELEPSLRAAVQRPFAWAATGLRRRTFFGRGNVWLAGDAVGHLHPLSGVGITLGLMDAEAAARAENLEAYRRERSLHVAELLASVLYLAFARSDASATRVRHGLLKMLRDNPAERRRTMRLLTGDDRDGQSFADAFLRATGQVLLSGAGQSATGHQSWSDWGRHLREDARWLAWPLRAALPPVDALFLRDASAPERASIARSLARTFTNRSAWS